MPQYPRSRLNHQRSGGHVNRILLILLLSLLAACATPEETDTVYARVCVPRKARIDLIYQANRSLRLDIWILLRTLGAVLRRNGG